MGDAVAFSRFCLVALIVACSWEERWLGVAIRGPRVPPRKSLLPAENITEAPNMGVAILGNPNWGPGEPPGLRIIATASTTTVNVGW